MKKVIIIVLLVVGIPILINEVINRPRYNLINDSKKLLKNIEEYKISNNISLKEIPINNKYTLDRTYNIKGEGIIMIDDSISFFLSRKNMCVIKLDNNSNLMFQKEKCPKYKMFNGLKEKIVTSGSGLYKENTYIYKGKDSSNLLMYEDSLWYILEIEDNTLKLVSLTNQSDTSYLTNDDYDKTVSDNTFLTKSMIGNEIKYLDIKDLIIRGNGTISSPLFIKEKKS